MLKIASEKGGLCIKGRAGTGKSYCAKQIAKQLENAAKIAFTNKAALNIKGKTIHRFLNINKEGKITSKCIEKLKKTVKYIIVDEISMVSKKLWRLLVEVKKATEITFILVGDHRQCAPVENEGVENYFDHPAVKYLSNNNLCELTIMKRYNQELWDALEDVDTVEVSKYGSKICKRNICYFNVTRKHVNHLIMNQCKPADALFSAAIDGDKYSQDIWIYRGLPLIARRTDKKVFVNNEYFVVDEIKDNIVVCHSERTDNDDKPYIHVFSIKSECLQKVMCVNYCSTVHKCQGETINEDFTIWNWNKMSKRLRYTAMSRATRPSQINFANNHPINSLKMSKEEERALQENIAKKIAGHKKYDVERKWETDVDVPYIQNMIENQGVRSI